MSRSILSHLSFNFYCSCQPQYRHANIAHQRDFFMAGVSPSIFVREMFTSSSETQGQLVGAGKRLNGRGKKSGEEKSRTKVEAPGILLLTDQFRNSLIFSVDAFSGWFTNILNLEVFFRFHCSRFNGLFRSRETLLHEQVNKWRTGEQKVWR